MKKIKCEVCGATIAMINDEGYLTIMCNHSQGRGNYKKRCKHTNIIKTGIRVDKS